MCMHMTLVKYSYDQWETEIESFFSTISLRADRRTDGQEDFRIDYEILTCFLFLFFLTNFRVLFLLSVSLSLVYACYVCNVLVIVFLLFWARSPDNYCIDVYVDVYVDV